MMKNMETEEERDDWVAAAFSDETLVAEFLSRLNQSSTSSSSYLPSYSFQLKYQTSFLSLPYGWGNHRPRSKPKLKESSSISVNTANTNRCSPTTPLSWNGSNSEDGGDYYSNSSRPSSSDLSRSIHKGGAYANGGTGNIYTNIRLNKKKSFTELKEEESSLLKERVTLKRELASLHFTLNQQRVRSESLKRIKIDLNLQIRTGDACTSSSCHSEAVFPSMHSEIEASITDHIHSAFPPHSKGFGSTKSCQIIGKDFQSDDMQGKGFFTLPDLNMMPSEEDGMS